MCKSSSSWPTGFIGVRRTKNCAFYLRNSQFQICRSIFKIWISSPLEIFCIKHFLTMAWFKSPSYGSNTILSNIERTRTSSYEHRSNSNLFINWWVNSKTLILDSNKLTSNIEPKRSLLNFPSNRLEHHFFELRTDLNMLFFSQTPYFWPGTIEHQILNIVWPITTDSLIETMG